MHKKHWLLPEGIDELLPPQARAMELLRRKLLDGFDAWGYELIMPPLLEYVESLMTTSAADLDIQTFKLVDQMSGRTLGLRSDITPQAARIDAHQLGREETTRLCYAASVLQTKTESFSSGRSPVQIGAEIYGHSGIASDLEIIFLMLETLSNAGIDELYLDIGHVGIFRGLAEEAGLSDFQEETLFSALQKKSPHDITHLIQEFNLSDAMGRLFLALAELSGDDALQRAEIIFSDASETVQQAVADLVSLNVSLSKRLPDLKIHFDLSELRGYHYHTGIVFAVYISKMGEEIARGGRYDHIGEIFGRARAACGFSADLLRLFRLTHTDVPPLDEKSVFTPFSDDAQLLSKVDELRAKGYRVINGLSDSESAQALGCEQCLVLKNSQWVLEKVV